MPLLTAPLCRSAPNYATIHAAQYHRKSRQKISARQPLKNILWSRNMKKIQPGRSFPLGATVSPNGVNFSVFSKNGTAVELLLFDEGKYDQPARVIPFDPVRNKTFYYWHMLVPDIKGGQVYAYRVHGPFN